MTNYGLEMRFEPCRRGLCGRQEVGMPSDLDVADAYLCAYDFVAYGFHRLDELSQVR